VVCVAIAAAPTRLRFLADCINGRAYAAALRPSPSIVVCLYRICIVAERCVLEQKLLLTLDSL